MMEATVQKRESRDERADRIARELITAERTARNKKTARLRAIRLEMGSGAQA